MSFHFNDHLRQTNNSLCYGEIAQIDWNKRQVRVQLGEILTNWLPMPAFTGENFKFWYPVREKMQVILNVAGGDYNTAAIVGMLWSDKVPAPEIPVSARPHTLLLETSSGDRVELDLQAQKLTLQFSEIVLLSDKLTHNGVNIGADHCHGNVQTGNSKTGAPS